MRIGQASRLVSSSDIAKTRAGLADGSVDIVIGTHALLAKTIEFKNLGLVVVDEEQHFGVAHKERLKELRTEVHVLTLTATPIPRTLAMSLEGLRDFSVISTAPQRRLAIKTFVAPWSEGTVREAVLRELKRGGQVYFLYNEVDTIETMRERLMRLLPEARIAVAHGQMRERDLERVMREFTQQRHSVLLCSTIIETGIDIPTANTIVIHRADRFGLAQLHQLRGRVGRSHHQAYAYLLTPPVERYGRDTLRSPLVDAAHPSRAPGANLPDGLGTAARKRLEAIQAMEELGSGFYLAMHDLEIRGAGEVLGDSQSGDIQEIGFDLYTRMLDRAVRALRDGGGIDMDEPFDPAIEVNLHTPALLPDAYCGDVHQRLTLYKRMANCEAREDLDAIREELVDRFGDLPEPAQALLECHALRIAARPLGVIRVDATHEAVQLQFVKQPPIDAGRIIELIRSRRNYRMSGPDRLRADSKLPTWQERGRAARDLMRQLSP
jgi:transcription-repair coupling factor (superfamily II helicase)